MLLVFLLLLLGGRGALAGDSLNELAPRVDRRIELLSIVFRLAGASDFTSVPQSSYLRDVDRYFERSKRHPLITHVRALQHRLHREGDDADVWAVLALALHLGDAPGLAPLVPYGAMPNEDAWDNRLLLSPELVRLLQRFYRDARCAEFFAAQASYIAGVEDEYRRQGIALNADWLKALFALPPTERYRPVLSLFGAGDFGYFRVNYDKTRRDTYTVIAVPPVDDSGSRGDLKAEAIARSSLHEYIHAFTNQAVDRHFSQLRVSAEALLRDPEVSRRTQGRFYDNATFLLYESLVRASSILYLSHSAGIPTDRAEEIAAQEKAGFLWIGGLVELLETYAANRDRYRSLEDLMPQVVHYFALKATGRADGAETLSFSGWSWPRANTPSRAPRCLQSIRHSGPICR